jgi:hypothetical protein
MLIVAMDANFRLQSRLRASSLKHPALSPGWAYFIDNSPYAGFIKDYVDDEEVSQFSDVMSAPTHFQTDQILCQFSSSPQHAYQEVQGSPSNRPRCCQLCSHIIQWIVSIVNRLQDLTIPHC